MTESQGQGRFRRQIPLMDMTLVGVGAIIGSGWLFAVAIIASIAGPAGCISWLIGGIVPRGDALGCEMQRPVLSPGLAVFSFPEDFGVTLCARVSR